MKSTRSLPSRPFRPFRSVALALVGSLVLACGGPPTTQTSQAGNVAVAAAPDEAAARAAWDAAMKLRFAGDALAADAALVQLAATHPDTRYGRAATGQGGMAFVGLMTVGIMGAVAVPAFTKYIQRSKTAEARANVRRIGEGAEAFGGTGCAKLGKACAKKFAFPASVPLTPATSACLNAVSVAHQPDPARWQNPTWKALGFTLDGPSLYQYEFISAGQGTGASFTARAVGDLNCDGIFSTFERVGTLNAAGNVEGGAGTFENQELE